MTCFGYVQDISRIHPLLNRTQYAEFQGERMQSGNLKSWQS
jgi:hypothetical protein